jgi:hypothetical protein
MSKTKPRADEKSSPSPMPPALNMLPRRWHRTFANGMRECDFTTVRFTLEAHSSAWDTLTIEIDEHNGAPSSKLLVRGQIEAAEIPGQLRWLADAIAQHGDNKSGAIRDHVTFEKSYGGGA